VALRVILTVWLLWGYFSAIGEGILTHKAEYIIVGLLDLTAFMILMRGLV
jgi:hypothetical protein